MPSANNKAPEVRASIIMAASQWAVYLTEKELKSSRTAAPASFHELLTRNFSAAYAYIVEALDKVEADLVASNKE